MYSSRNSLKILGILVALALALTLLQTASALSPLDPTADIPWDEDAVQAGTQRTFANVGAIQSAFTNARRHEEAQLGLPANSLGNMTLPAQASWNALSLAQKALLIVNSERVARAGVNYGAGPVLGLPLEGVEGNIITLSQAFADYMIANDFWAHNAPAQGPAPFAGTRPGDRIDNDPVIGNGTGTGGANCHQALGGSENLSAFASSPGTTIPMPVERAIYGFIYVDAGMAWEHRQLALLQDQSATGGAGFINDRGSAASEGFLGIGNAGVTDGSYSFFDPVMFPVQQAVVFMMFDPTPDAACNYTGGTGNNPPVLTPIPDQMVPEMGNVSIPLMATDQDMDTLTLTASNLPAFCALTDNGGGMGSIDCMPGAGTANTYPVTVTATDNGVPVMTAMAPFDIVVTPVGGGTITQCSTPGLAIPDGNPATPAVNTLAIADPRGISDLNLSLTAPHTWVGDLTVTLRHTDTGTEVVVLDRPGEPASGNGCSNDNIDVILDDEGASPAEDACAATPPAIGGTLTPNNALSAFDGESANGTWELSVADHVGQDTGTLQAWCVTITPAAVGNNPPVLTPIANQTVAEMGILSVPLMATNPDMNTLVFSAKGLPGFCALTNGGTGSIDCMPGAGTANTYTASN